MASLSFTLTPEEREQIRAEIAGLTGKERHRAWGRLRSRVLRQRPDFRQADNERKAARGREVYHANLEGSRRKGVEKWHRRRERAKARAEHRTCAMRLF